MKICGKAELKSDWDITFRNQKQIHVKRTLSFNKAESLNQLKMQKKSGLAKRPDSFFESAVKY